MKLRIEVQTKLYIDESNQVIIKDVWEHKSTPKQKQGISCQIEYQEF